jgi:hypothetical protein
MKVRASRTFPDFAFARWPMAAGLFSFQGGRCLPQSVASGFAHFDSVWSASYLGRALNNRWSGDK